MRKGMCNFHFLFADAYILHFHTMVSIVITIGCLLFVLIVAWLFVPSIVWSSLLVFCSCTIGHLTIGCLFLLLFGCLFVLLICHHSWLFLYQWSAHYWLFVLILIPHGWVAAYSQSPTKGEGRRAQMIMMRMPMRILAYISRWCNRQRIWSKTGGRIQRMQRIQRWSRQYICSTEFSWTTRKLQCMSGPSDDKH